MADVLINKVFNAPVFTWGAANLVRQNDSRKTYLAAVRAADMGDILPLLKFARS